MYNTGYQHYLAIGETVGHLSCLLFGFLAGFGVGARRACGGWIAKQCIVWQAKRGRDR
jgi:hypothetical protein